MSMFVKICGMTTPEAVRAALDNSVDAIGFVIAPSVRVVTPQRASELAAPARRRVYCVAVTRHPQRSLIMKALTGHEVEPALIMREAKVGDRYLLCSDGLSDPVSHETIAEALQIPDVTDAADRLIELALRGGRRRQQSDGRPDHRQGGRCVRHQPQSDPGDPAEGAVARHRDRAQLHRLPGVDGRRVP